MDPITLIIGALGIVDTAIGLYEKYTPAGIAATISAKAESEGRDVTEDELNVIKSLQWMAENPGRKYATESNGVSADPPAEHS